MKYENADNVFPERLLIEIQKYIQGQIVYIPRSKGMRKDWGKFSGTRKYLNNRNKEIYKKFNTGKTINQLAEEYYLSVHSIKKIVYSKKNS
ncbi:MAG: hypothetical protein FH751_03390 [Firmicutes bacterium]|nr:hypothetical protein [Bacillota bacterium]